MTDQLQPWVWVRRALALALLFMLAGWALGVVGALTSPWVGWVGGAIGLVLLGGGWAVSRIGGAGLAASLIGLVAAGGTSIEGHHARVAITAPIAELPSLAAWDPQGPVIAAHVAELSLLTKLAGHASVRSGSGKNATTTRQIATPLLDEALGQVVGFHCRSANGERRQGGRWVLSSETWAGSGPMTCAPAVKLALQACASRQIAVAPGAEARFVEVFASESDLRAAYNLAAVVGVPLLLFVLYLVFVVLLRKRGAESQRFQG